MVFAAALPAIAVASGHAARIGITSSGMRSFGAQFVQSLPFGAGYSLGTYIGFPKNYQNKKYNTKGRSYYLMPYGYYPRRRYGRRYYNRRRPRYYRRSYRRYRRF